MMNEENHNHLMHFYDGILKTDDGQCLPIHRVLMSVISPFFSTAFMTKDRNHDSNICMVNGVKSEVLKQIIDYSFLNKIEISDQNVQDLLLAADYLEIKQLLLECCDFIRSNLSERTCLRFYDVSRKLEHLGLAKSCHRYIEIHFEKILKEETESLLKINYDSIATLLQSDNLNVSGEETILEAICLWVCKDPEERIGTMENLLQYLRMSKEEFSFVINNLGHSIITEGLVEFLKQLPTNAKQETRRPLPASKMCIALEHTPDTCTLRITYDNTMDFWRLLCRIPFKPTATVCDTSGNMYIFQGQHCWHFRPDQDSIQLPDLRLFRSDYGVAVVNGFLYVVGGVISGPLASKLTAVERYNPATGQWAWVQTMLFASSGSVAVVRKKIYSVGHYMDPDLSEDVITMQRYDPDFNLWTLLKHVPNFKEVSSVSALRDRIYVLGRSRTGLVVMRFNIELNIWRTFIRIPPDKFQEPRGYAFNDSFILYEGAEIPDRRASVWSKVTKWTESSHPLLANLERFEIFAIEDCAMLDNLRHRTGFQWTNIAPSHLTED